MKTLKEGSGEEDRVKFLQEAAIMGQFKHTNVVEMYGVVTQGEPVSFGYQYYPYPHCKNWSMLCTLLVCAETKLLLCTHQQCGTQHASVPGCHNNPGEVQLFVCVHNCNITKCVHF